MVSTVDIPISVPFFPTLHLSLKGRSVITLRGHMSCNAYTFLKIIYDGWNSHFILIALYQFSCTLEDHTCFEALLPECIFITQSKLEIDTEPALLTNKNALHFSRFS